MGNRKNKIFTLSALFLLVTSILLVGTNIPTNALEAQSIYLHGPSLSPIHMHSDITLKPIHMHAKGLIDLSQPMGIVWHELYPNYCQSWNLTSWEDYEEPLGELSPDDQIDMVNLDTNKTEWYHVDRITITLLLSGPYPAPQHEPAEPTMAIELKLPYYEPGVLSSPVCTPWHEVWPNYSNIYHLANWIDDPTNPNGVLDFTDAINLTDVNTGVSAWWHVEEVGTDIILRWKMMEPVGTWWHELYPEYSKWWNLTSWEDSNDDGFPSPCDQVDMTEEESETKIWYHLDRVTITINVTTVDETAKWRMLELKTQEFEEMFYCLKYPLYSLWHEVYPNYSNVYNLTMWDPVNPKFDNCNGVLDPCDYIVLLNMTSGKEELYHIEDMSYDIILNKKISNPVCTTWHELYPEYSNEYHIDGWEDNGDNLLSPCDQITMSLLPEGLMTKYHVENVTITLKLSSWIEPLGFMFVEAEAPFESMYWPKINPYGGVWHEVYPNFCTNYSVMEWEDNCNGVLDHCDNLTLINLKNETISFWHVEEVAVDMVVTEAPIHDVAVISVSSLYPQVNQGEVDPINVTVENQGDFSETVDVYAFYDGNLAAPKQTIVLNPGENRTLTFNWNTTGVPLGTYTISANATIPIDDDPLDNYLSDGEQEVIPELPSIIILPLFMLSTLAVTAFKLKKKKR